MSLSICIKQVVVLCASVALALYPLRVFSQDTSSEAEVVKKALEASSSLRAQKPFLVLCETDSGRKVIIQNMDTITKRDIYYQWQGQEYQRLMMVKNHESAPVYVSYRDFLNRMIIQSCEAKQDWTFNFQYYAFIKITGVTGGPPVIGCSSANTGGGTEKDCRYEYTVIVPPGYEACRLFCDITKRRHGKYNIVPVKWIGSQQEYPRFRGYKFSVTGHGDEDNPSRVYFENVSILAVSHYTPAAVRKECGCTIPKIPDNGPNQPISTNPESPKPAPVASPAKLQWQMVDKRENAIDLVIFNSGGSVGRFKFKVIVYDGDDKKWENFEEGFIDIAPNTEYRKGFHKWRAEDWKLVIQQPIAIP